MLKEGIKIILQKLLIKCMNGFFLINMHQSVGLLAMTHGLFSVLSENKYGNKQKTKIQHKTEKL